MPMRHTLSPLLKTKLQELPRSPKGLSVRLKAAILLPEATAFLYLFTQEMQLAVSPIQQLFEYRFLIVIST